MNRYKKWRVSRLHKKLNKLREDFKWAYEHKELLGADYDVFTGAIAGELVRKERTLRKLQKGEK